MKKHLLACILAPVFLISCAHRQDEVPPVVVPAQWPQKMQDMGHSLSDLMPYVFNETEFNSEKNQTVIAEKIKDFSNTSHKIDKEVAKKMLGEDPMVLDSLGQLKQEIDSAQTAFAKGNTRYSRFLLQHSMQYCFACHTRVHIGPQFKNWDISQEALSHLSPFQKAQMFVATRQFDKAKSTINSELDAPDTNIYEKEQLIKLYLAIVARGEDNPQEGYKFVSGLKKKSGLPSYLVQNFQPWEKSFTKWMGEKAKSKTKVLKLNSARDLIFKRQLMEDDYDNQSKYVDNLRAGSILHKILMQKNSDSQTAEAYFYLGVIYENVNETGFWELPEHYFSACVAKVPNSAWAQKCYLKYEQNMILGFSGSSGTFIPIEEKTKLDELKKLSGLKE